MMTTSVLFTPASSAAWSNRSTRSAGIRNVRVILRGLLIFCNFTPDQFFDFFVDKLNDFFMRGCQTAFCIYTLFVHFLFDKVIVPSSFNSSKYICDCSERSLFFLNQMNSCIDVQTMFTVIFPLV